MRLLLILAVCVLTACSAAPAAAGQWINDLSTYLTNGAGQLNWETLCRLDDRENGCDESDRWTQALWEDQCPENAGRRIPRRDLQIVHYRLTYEQLNQGRSVEWAVGLFGCDDPISPPDPPDPPSPPLSRLTVPNGSRFLVDEAGQRVDLRDATLFSAYALWLDASRRPALQDAIDTLKREGKVNSVRVLLNLAGPFWEGFGTDYRTPDFYGNLVPFARWLAGNEMYLNLGLIGSVENFGAVPNWSTREDVVSGHSTVIQEMRTYAARVVVRLAGETNLIWSGSNEPNQIGFGQDSAALIGIGGVMRRELDRAGWANAPMSIGAQGESEWFYARGPPANMFAYHLLRDPVDDYFFSLKREIGGDADAWPGHPVQSEEPANKGDLRRLDGRTDLADGTESTAFAYALAVSSRLKRTIPTFHCHECLWSRMDRPKTIASLRAWTAGLDAVPLNPRGNQWNGGHVGTMLSHPDETFPPGQTDPELQGPLRVWGRDHWAISLREPVGYDLPVQPGVETVHIERWGPWQARLLHRP